MSPATIAAMQGIVRLGFFDAGGLGNIGNTPRTVLISLAPLAVMGGFIALMLLPAGNGVQALRALFIITCALLAPMVVSHALARAFGREALWPRFAAAFNWCQWVIMAGVLAPALVVMNLAIALFGIPADTAGVLTLLAVFAYTLALYWFLARHALRLPGGRAAVFVLLTNLGTFLFLTIPRLLAQALA